MHPFNAIQKLGKIDELDIAKIACPAFVEY